MRVTAQIDNCVGSGECVLACPEVFGQNEDGTVTVLLAEPPPELHERVRNAVADCPAAVLEIADDDAA